MTAIWSRIWRNFWLDTGVKVGTMMLRHTIIIVHGLYQTYGPVWAEMFGKKQYPQYAAQFLKNQHDMVGNYPFMFSRDGRMNMWGRSICYRFAATAFYPYMNMTRPVM